MAIIRFKSRSLIRRFGSKPVRVPEPLAKQYIDRNQAIEVRKEVVVEEEVPGIEEAVPDEILPEEKEEVSEEEDDVQDHDLGFVLPGHSEPFFAVTGRNHFVSGQLQFERVHVHD